MVDINATKNLLTSVINIKVREVTTMGKSEGKIIQLTKRVFKEVATSSKLLYMLLNKASDKHIEAKL